MKSIDHFISLTTNQILLENIERSVNDPKPTNQV